MTVPAGVPALRASLLKLYLEEVPALWPEDEPAIRAALGPEALARIGRTSGHEWVPIAFEVAILRAVHARRGDEGARRLGRHVGHAATRSALLRPLVAAVLGMMGRRPDALVHLGVAGWSLATRNAGRPLVSPAGACARAIVMHDLPDVMRDRALLLRIGGSAESLLEHVGWRTALELDWEEAAPRATLRLSWSHAA